jgi:hypothetical protein
MRQSKVWGNDDDDNNSNKNNNNNVLNAKRTSKSV